MHNSLKMSVSFIFHTNILYAFLISSMDAIRPSHSILLYFIILTLFGEEHKL
jgi:hypothetical protein